MPAVRFAWSPTLVALRRDVCPRAHWERKTRRWVMSDRDAQTFLQDAHRRLDFCRSAARIEIDDVTWVVGFVEGAPRVDS